MDTISEAYARALQWSEELWEVSKYTHLAISHCPDRIKKNEVLLAKFDQSWILFKSGKTTQEPVLKNLLDWVIDLSIIVDDMKPLLRIDVEPLRIDFKRGEFGFSYEHVRHEEMALK